MDERQFELPLYTTRRSQRAKRVTLRIAPGTGVEVVVPERYDERRIPDLIAEHQRWIERRTRQLRRKAAGAALLDRTPLPRTIHLAACRERWTVDYRHDAGAAPRLSQIGERALRLRIDLHDLQRAQACLDRWCRRRAAAFLPERLQALAEQSGLR
jgi:predicted metal-dependent hydrolase